MWHPDRKVDRKMKAIANKKRRGVTKSGPLLLIALPGIAYLLINNYLPMFGVFLAFKDYNYVKGLFGSDWCGFKNFEYLFRQDAFTIVRNTILYNLTFIVLGTAAAIFVAILMCELGDKFRVKFFQSSLLLPNLLSWVVIGFIGFAFLNSDTGFINNTVIKFFGGKDVAWYTTPKYWPVILTIVFMWKSVGYSCIIYMASISGIDKSIFEAAKIDGATKLEQIRFVTIPMLKPTVIIMTLMAVGRIFYSDFGLFYQVPMNSGALYNVTQTIDTYVYHGLMELNDVGMSAAAGLYQSVIGFVLVISANAVVRKVDSDNALF
jgi:putative aldouronate transport system permease protein